MKTESEQLWYTWSNKGFGATGFQIRAVSQGFFTPSQHTHAGNATADEDESTKGVTIDLNNERIQTLLKYVRYELPVGTDVSKLQPPEQAPVTLAFLNIGQETILVHKVFAGRRASASRRRMSIFLI